jgi:hypothetical protein
MNPKYIRAIGVGLVIAFAISGGLAYTFARLGAPDLKLAIFCGVVIGAPIAYAMANLAGNRAVANASEADKRAALARTAPADRALLFIYREGFVAKLAGMNIAVDAKPVAQLKAPRFTWVSVAPGARKIEAVFGGLAGAQSRTGELTITAAAGATVVVRITLAMGWTQNGITLTPVEDLDLARRVMGGMPMVAAETPDL